MGASKPWYARSSFAGAVLATAILAWVIVRSGYTAVTDEQFATVVGLWLTFFAYLGASPSAKPEKPTPEEPV